MTAKEYLGQIEELEKCVELNTRNIERWKVERFNCTCDPSREFVSGGGSANATYARLTEDIRDAEEENARMIKFRNKIMVEITEEPAKYSDLLYAIYVNRKTLLEYALGVGVPYDTTRKRHLRALAHFEEKHFLEKYENGTTKHNDRDSMVDGRVG